MTQLMSADVPDVAQALQELNEKLERAGISEIITEANRQVREWMQRKE